jgi:NADH dehydrogenase (ubiquinone) Fe-S protein 3
LTDQIVVFSLLIIISVLPATIRRHDGKLRESLIEFGQYVGQCMPKFVQKVVVTGTDELEVCNFCFYRKIPDAFQTVFYVIQIMIAPEGVIPTVMFLKNHHHCLFWNLVDIAAMDVPTRQYRFEVRCFISFNKILRITVLFVEKR